MTGIPTFADLPKVELHTHLDCSLMLETVRALLGAVSPEQYSSDFVAPRECRDLTDFLRCIDPAIALLQTKEALCSATVDLIAQLAADNVVYAEMRFAPHLHMREGLSADTVVKTVLDAMRAARPRHKIECGLILCTLRHFSESTGLEVVELVDRYRSSGVVALDLAGDEAGFPLDSHIEPFRVARDSGLHTIAHAGEAKGWESVEETLDKLKPSRIGHGVRSIENPGTVARLIDNGTHLEICPSCNIQTGIWPVYRDHPVDLLLKAGVSLGINTDARATTAVTLEKEYQLLNRHFGWDKDEFRRINREALLNSFAPEPTKQNLQRVFD